MPRAANVAANAHHSVPSALPSTEPISAEPLGCPETGLVCPALAALFGPHAPINAEARNWVLALAPCADCRVAFECGRNSLRHLRLGQREREILTAAEAGALAVTEPGMSRSVSAARRRAAQSLGKAGLVASITPSLAERGRSQRATVALTELGRYVMAAYGRYIRAGKPVRWTRPLRGVSFPGRDPAELRDEAMARTQSALRDTLTELKGALVAAISRPLTSPEKLDAITRHLESKASLLRAVLEPSR